MTRIPMGAASTRSPEPTRSRPMAALRFMTPACGSCAGCDARHGKCGRVRMVGEWFLGDTKMGGALRAKFLKFCKCINDFAGFIERFQPPSLRATDRCLHVR